MSFIRRYTKKAIISTKSGYFGAKAAFSPFGVGNYTVKSKKTAFASKLPRFGAKLAFSPSK